MNIKNAVTKTEQTERKRQEPLGFRLTKLMVPFSLNPALETEDEKSTNALSKIEVYISVSSISEQKANTNLYTWILERF